MTNNANKILVVVDASYWTYYVLFGALSEFQKKHEDEAKIWLKNPEDVDQSNLPDLTNCQTYTRILRKYVMRRIESIDYLEKLMCQNSIDAADGQDIVFCMDDKLSNNFRKSLATTYKATRHVGKHQFDLEKVKRYIMNVIFPDLDVVKSHDIKIVKVIGAEGDDVIATLITNYKDKYLDTLLIASDHDFLQLDGIKQVDLAGRIVARNKPDEQEVTAAEFLLQKILMGDNSDNIPQVFPRCGPKTALKLVRDKELLKARLKEDQNAATQFMTNKKLISFNEIPEELTNNILTECKSILKPDEHIDIDLSGVLNI